MTWDISNLDLDSKNFLTPLLTIQAVECEDRDWGQVLKITLAENVICDDAILNTMHLGHTPTK